MRPAEGRRDCSDDRPGTSILFLPLERIAILFPARLSGGS